MQAALGEVGAPPNGPSVLGGVVGAGHEDGGCDLIRGISTPQLHSESGALLCLLRSSSCAHFSLLRQFCAFDPSIDDSDSTMHEVLLVMG